MAPLPHVPASRHRKSDPEQCASCGQAWPCEVARYQQEVRELRAELAVLRQGNAEQVDTARGLW